MPRYTDIDKLITEYDRVHVGPAGGARKLMVEAPIADVVPRAEVEYWKEQCFHACMNNGCLDKAIVDAAVAREIFWEIEKKSCTISETNTAAGYTRVICYQISSETLEELKKKYTEGQQ